MDYNLDSSDRQRLGNGQARAQRQSGAGQRRDPVGANGTQTEVVTLGGSDRKTMSPEDIKKYLADFIEVNPDMWLNIPAEAQVAWTVKGSEPLQKRFYPGGFVVKNYFHKKEGKHVFTVRSLGAGQFQMNPDINNIDKMYKRYDKHSYIETRLVEASLLQKRLQIETLQAEMTALKATIADLKTEVDTLKRKK